MSGELPKLTAVIPRQAIRFPLVAASPVPALTELVRSLVEAGRLKPAQEEPALIGLLKREAIGPTGIGHGIAVPHVRLPGLSQIAGAFGASVQGIPFNTPDRKMVHAVFLFLAPEHDNEGYLRLLALVSRIVSDGTFVAAVRAAETAARVAALLREFEARIQG